MNVIKYWRLSEDKRSLILLPSKEGLNIIRDHLKKREINYSEYIEKMGEKAGIIAFKIDLDFPVKYMEYVIRLVANTVSIYMFTEQETKHYLHLPYDA